MLNISFFRKDDSSENIGASGKTLHEIIGELSISYRRLLTDEENGKYHWKGISRRREEVRAFEDMSKYFFQEVIKEQGRNRKFAYWVLIAGFVLSITFLLK